MPRLRWSLTKSTLPRLQVKFAIKSAEEYSYESYTKMQMTECPAASSSESAKLFHVGMWWYVHIPSYPFFSDQLWISHGAVAAALESNLQTINRSSKFCSCWRCPILPEVGPWVWGRNPGETFGLLPVPLVGGFWFWFLNPQIFHLWYIYCI